jgi:D-3-phosphoglycerate dehydrogenase
MFKIKTLNNISEAGLSLLPADMYEVSTDCENPDAILVRSANMLDMELPSNLKAIARAGAGYNNIPVDKCTERGIVVFNTPGANANAVKELVLASLFMSSRRIISGITWAQSLKGKGPEVEKLVEKGKAQFVGPEIKGKRLGVIGLGAIGTLVANDALALGMEVIGYDPYISISSAWNLSSSVMRANTLDQLITTSDYITLHLPVDNNTKGMFNNQLFEKMKPGVRIINLARGELVNNEDLLAHLESGHISCYVTDFPTEALLGVENVIAIPHLGASTPESEENCAVTAVQQLRDFLERGEIRNSVNFPPCYLDHPIHKRIITAHQNIPNMVGQITTVLASHKINIADMVTHHKGTMGYNIIDLDEGELTEKVLSGIRNIDGVRMIRVIKE